MDTLQDHVTLVGSNPSRAARVWAGYRELTVLQLGVYVSLKACGTEAVQAATNNVHFRLRYILQADGA